MRTIPLIFRFSFVFFSFIFFSSTAFAQVTSLQVIPEVQQFEAKEGTFSLSKNILIKVNVTKNDSLMEVAKQLKTELKEQFNITSSIQSTKRSQAESKNEILLSYSNQKLRNKEAYTLNLDSSKGLTIQGASRNGTFWGTRTLLQLIQNHQNSIPTGLITDYPDFPSRGFMIDTGRKFFTIDYLRDYVKILSYYKMNEFHVHLNDNGFKSYFDNDWSKTYAAFRLESETYPGLTSKDGYYTKKEFRDLQLLGMQYGVNVIPEIDIPAHSLAFTRYKPMLKASAPYADDHLDILNDEKLPFIYDFFDKLFDEYIKGDQPTFVGPDVHVGTDEYIKEGRGRDVDNKQAQRFREFTNHYLKYIADLGKTPRLWGGLEWLKDKPLTPVSPVGGAVMNAWSRDWVNADEMLEKGFKIISTPDVWLYIVPAAGYYKDFLDIEWIYKQYRPEMVNGTLTFPNFQPGLLGATFAVWNDVVGNGISQLDVHDRTMPAVKVVGTKNWKATPEKSYEDYARLAKESIDGLGINLSGVYSTKKITEIANQLGTNSTKFNGNHEVHLGGNHIGFKYDISFDIKPYTGNNADAILFQSVYEKITLNTNGLGRLGFARDGYVNTFEFVLKNNVWQNLRLVGDNSSLTLYVDGKKQSTLTAYKKTEGLPNNLIYHQTLHFPLEKAGDKNNGFKGELKNLQIVYIDADEIKNEFSTTKKEISEGLYYIKYGDLYLTNTFEKGQRPKFQEKAKDSTQQQFKIIKAPATNRYKIVSATQDELYINEIGAFGKNPYSDLWNTYNFYLKDGKFAIQNAGNGGKSFWRVVNDNFYPGQENYNDTNYIIQLEKID